MAAPCHIPLIKLLGITPSGLNSSSDSEIRVFYDYVHAMQEALFTDPLEIILKVIQLDLFGEIDSNITFDYEPLYALDGEALARVRKSDADTAQVLIHGGVISAGEERLRLVGDPNSGYQGLDGALPAGMGQDGGINNGGGNTNHDPKTGRFTFKGMGAEEINEISDLSNRATRTLGSTWVGRRAQTMADILTNTGEALGQGAASLQTGYRDDDDANRHVTSLEHDIVNLLWDRKGKGGRGRAGVLPTGAKMAGEEPKETQAAEKETTEKSGKSGGGGIDPKKAVIGAMAGAAVGEGEQLRRQFPAAKREEAEAQSKQSKVNAQAEAAVGGQVEYNVITKNAYGINEVHLEPYVDLASHKSLNVLDLHKKKFRPTEAAAGVQLQSVFGKLGMV